MINLFLTYARENLNLENLNLLVGEDNLSAQRFYEKCGFNYSGESLEKGGTQMLVMEIHLI